MRGLVVVRAPQPSSRASPDKREAAWGKTNLAATWCASVTASRWKRGTKAPARRRARWSRSRRGTVSAIEAARVARGGARLEGAAVADGAAFEQPVDVNHREKSEQPPRQLRERIVQRKMVAERMRRLMREVAHRVRRLGQQAQLEQRQQAPLLQPRPTTPQLLSLPPPASASAVRAAGAQPSGLAQHDPSEPGAPRDWRPARAPRTGLRGAPGLLRACHETRGLGPSFAPGDAAATAAPRCDSSPPHSERQRLCLVRQQAR